MLDGCEAQCFFTPECIKDCQKICNITCGQVQIFLYANECSMNVLFIVPFSIKC